MGSACSVASLETFGKEFDMTNIARRRRRSLKRNRTREHSTTVTKHRAADEASEQRIYVVFMLR